MTASISQTDRAPGSTFVPGPGGYVIMIVISWLVFTVLSLLLLGFTEGGTHLVAYAPLVLILCATYGLPVAVVGALLLGAISARLSAVAQVLAAALIGGVLAAPWVRITFPLDAAAPTLAIAALTAVSAGAGRLLADRWIHRPVPAPSDVSTGSTNGSRGPKRGPLWTKIGH